MYIMWHESLLWTLDILWTWVSAKCSFELSISDLDIKLHMEQKLYDDHNDDYKWDNTISKSFRLCQTKSKKVDIIWQSRFEFKTTSQDSNTDCKSLKGKVTRSQKMTFWSICCLQYGLSCVEIIWSEFVSEASVLNTVYLWIHNVFL